MKEIIGQTLFYVVVSLTLTTAIVVNSTGIVYHAKSSSSYIDPVSTDLNDLRARPIRH